MEHLEQIARQDGGLTRVRDNLQSIEDVEKGPLREAVRRAQQDV